MNAVDTVKLLRKYNDCPDCGNDSLGNEEGSVLVDENIFIRTCKCGFKVEVDVTKDKF